jgi:hypothetical protein
LTVVGLTGNGLTDEAAVGIAEALHAAAGSRLQRIFLNENRIGDIGGIALASALAASAGMQRLGLSQNRIGCAGGASLLEAAARRSSLVSTCAPVLHHALLHRSMCPWVAAWFCLMQRVLRPDMRLWEPDARRSHVLCEGRCRAKNQHQEPWVTGYATLAASGSEPLAITAFSSAASR